MKIIEMENTPLTELRAVASGLGIPNANRLKKENLMIKIRQYEAEKEGLEVRGGVLEIMNEGIGFLRTNYQIGPDDVYVSQAQLRRYELRGGDLVIGNVRPPRETERHYGLLKVESVNGLSPEEAAQRPNFESLTPIFPDKRFDLETDRTILSSRLINLIAPIGRGQRGMIVSPPKAGKTTILKQLANSISEKHPEVHLIIALIGERPEEVTDMDRSVDAEVVASTFDEPVSAHVRTAEIALTRQTPDRSRPGCGHPDGLPHPPGPCLQPGGQSLRAHAFRRYGPICPLPAQALFRRRPQPGRRRVSDHYCHCPG